MPRNFLPNIVVDGREQNWRSDFAAPPVTQFRPHNRNAQVGDLFEVNVLEVLQRISGNPVGSLLLQDILAQTERMRIIPQITRGTANTDYYGLHQASAAPANWRAAIAQGYRLPTRSGRPAPWPGSGRGSDTIIRYTSWHWIMRDAPPGHQRDEVLFHEMVHGLRQMRGLLLQMPMTGSDIHYHNSDEWLAVMLSNVYASADSNSRPLRADHDGSMIMTREAQEFFLHRVRDPQDRWYELITQLYQEMPIFSRGVGDVRCNFNPVRAWQERGAIRRVRQH